MAALLLGKGKLFGIARIARIASLLMASIPLMASVPAEDVNTLPSAGPYWNSANIRSYHYRLAAKPWDGDYGRYDLTFLIGCEWKLANFSSAALATSLL